MYLKNVRCEECRENITISYMYSIQFALGKNNGKGILLCEKCTKDLQFELNKNL